MIVTAEISLYPLNSDFEAIIIDFIKALKEHDDVEVFTHSMSTYVRGSANQVFPAIQYAFEKVGGSSDTLSLVIKIINRPLKPEAGPLNFE